MPPRRINRDNLPRLRCRGGLRFGWISQARWSPNGELLAIAGGDGIALYRGGFGGAPDIRLTAHGAPVKDIAFSPDSALLASASADTTIKLWSLKDAAAPELTTLLGHASSAEAVAFSPAGRLLASGGAEGEIRLWDAENGAAMMRLRGHSDEVTALAFDHLGERLFSGGRDKSIFGWHLGAGFQRSRLGGHDDWLRDIAWQPRSGILASASKDMTIRLWSADGESQSQPYSSACGRRRCAGLHAGWQIASSAAAATT